MTKIMGLKPDMDRQARGRLFAALVDDLHIVRTEAAVLGILQVMIQESLFLGSAHTEENSLLHLILMAVIHDSSNPQIDDLAKRLIDFHRQPERAVHNQELLRIARELGLTDA